MHMFDLGSVVVQERFDHKDHKHSQETHSLVQTQMGKELHQVKKGATNAKYKDQRLHQPHTNFSRVYKGGRLKSGQSQVIPKFV